MDKMNYFKYPSPYLMPGLPRRNAKMRSLGEIFGGKAAFDIILEIVSDKTAIAKKDLTNRCRKKEFVMARHLIRYFCAEYLSSYVSLMDVARWLSNFRISDHSGVIHGRDLIRSILHDKSTSHYADQVKDLVTKIDERLKQITYESNSSYG